MLVYDARVARHASAEWLRCGAALLSALSLGLAACSSDSNGSPDTGAAGTSGPGAGGAGGAGGDGSVGGAGGIGPQPRPFWCPDYVEDDAAAGWVRVNVTIPGRGTGYMDSPIQTCQVGATSWSLSASGIESDGVDTTVMSFAIDRIYGGPGRYAGTLSEGISGSLSHDDLGTTPFVSVASSDCEICVNDDGLSGTVTCWDLERAVGGAPQTAFISAGEFKCANAQAKPATAPTVPPPSGSGVGGLPDGAVLCHYLAQLDCPGRPDADQCVQHSDSIALGSTCPDEWIQWLNCAEAQPSSDYDCGDDGDTLVMLSGACASELGVLRECRAAAAVPTSPECDYFCAKLQLCSETCDRTVDCTVFSPHCAASTLAHLSCVSDALTCSTGGGYTYVGCDYDDSVCP